MMSFLNDLGAITVYMCRHDSGDRGWVSDGDVPCTVYESLDSLGGTN